MQRLFYYNDEQKVDELEPLYFLVNVTSLHVLT